MLNIQGPAQNYCDGISRRSFLSIGSLAIGGINLAQLLQAESSTGKSNRSVILVYLSGGIAHQDTVDLKPNAPSEVRGEFKPIPTRVPGIQICELLPRLAQCTDRMAILRSVVGQIDEHSSFQSTAGFPMGIVQREGKPHFGSVIAKIKGSVDPVIPSFVDLFPTMQHRPYNSPNAGFLGRSSQAVKVDSNDLGAMELKGRSFSEFQDRKKLLSQIDFLKENAATQLASMDANYHRAFDVLTSNKLLQAMDIQRESPKVIERYGHGSPKHMGDGAPMWNDQLLIARRLVEAGVRVVTVAYGFWDTHGQNFRHLKEHLPLFDRGISALVEDLYDRGLDKECTLLVWGEFGRSPKINKDAGRDHWSPVNSAIFAGGGLKVGQVLGSTDSTAATAKDFPIHYRDVLATVYSTLGIDCHSMIYDVSNRPNPILPPEAKPISRLF